MIVTSFHRSLVTVVIGDRANEKSQPSSLNSTSGALT